MTKLKYTPGRWYFDKEYLGEGTAVLSDQFDGTRYSNRSDGLVCRVAGEDAEANARLIAAAPDMLHFVEMVAAGHITQQGCIDAAQRLLQRLEE